MFLLGLLAAELFEEEDNIQEVIIPAPAHGDFIDEIVANACSTSPLPYRPTYYREEEEEEALNIAAIAAVLGAFKRY